MPYINFLPLERDDSGKQLSTWGMMSNDPSFLEDEPAHVATVPFGRRTHLPAEEIMLYSRPTTVPAPSFEDQATTPRPAIMERSREFYQDSEVDIVSFALTNHFANKPFRFQISLSETILAVLCQTSII